MGHVLQVHGDYTSVMEERGQAILHDSKTGITFGASDPRADGAAVPEQPNFFGAPVKR
jgi:gamma-glutamyltranspeptidase/glutathione hydrolase